MFKKLILAIATLIATMSFAFAQVDVNKADQAALDGVKGIGPAISKRIIDERTKNGPYKDWADLETRVKGIGDKNSAKFSDAGLTVNGQAKSGSTPAPAKAAKAPKSAAKTTAAATTAAPAAPAAAADKDAKPAADATADKDAKPKKTKKSKKDKDAAKADDAKK
jgi:DNA polymerase III alpha subunit